MHKIKSILVFLFLILLVSTRFIGLDWGLPHPMHPDERNMVNAILQLKCDWPVIFDNQPNQFSIKDCLNPNFYAYGQFPLYLGYVVAYLLKIIQGNLLVPLNFDEATLGLRIVSAVATILNVWVLFKIINFFTPKMNPSLRLTGLLVLTFSPFFIQFSHFGTTESLLMLYYSLIIYLSLLFWRDKLQSSSFYILTALLSGMAIATKVSSLLFLIVPLAVIFDKKGNNFIGRMLDICYLVSLTLIFCILFSPHNFISFTQFLGAMGYESDVALGVYRAFYTRQFEYSVPIVFQLQKIFPYSLGWPIFIFSLLGFFLLPLNKEYNILRLAILAGFIPNAFFYAKWSRFISPVLPLLQLLAVLIVLKGYNYLAVHLISRLKVLKKDSASQLAKFVNSGLLFSLCTLLIVFILPGISYLSIYLKQDVRFTVSEWVYKNVPENGYVLSETANVVDVPIHNPKKPGLAPVGINYISFNFYDLDENLALQSQLAEHLEKAEFIFVPSRRIFANHYCPKGEMRLISERHLNFSLMQEGEKCEFVRKKYPRLQVYYDNLFSGKAGFIKVAEFSEFAKISFFERTLFELPDEEAEETWTVFDHPVFRIYKKI